LKKTDEIYYKTGSVADGSKRPPLYLIANDLTFALNVTVEDFTIWTESGTQIVNKINNVFGIGDDSYGANNGIKSLSGTESPSTYTSSYTVTATPTNWEAPTTPSWAAPSTGYGSKFSDFCFCHFFKGYLTSCSLYSDPGLSACSSLASRWNRLRPALLGNILILSIHLVNSHVFFI
jgi:hypothetical protein